MDRPKINTIGDSHCWHAWLNIPNVEFHLMGPMLMYTFGKFKPIITKGIPTDEIICFCWGEIDCRCHVNKYLPYQKTIDDLVKNYIEAIKLNTKEFNPEYVWIYNVAPPTHKDTIPGNPAFPFLGSDEERLQYVKYMNQKLKESGYTFVDLYSKHSDKEGFINKDLSIDRIHISNEEHIVDWINKWKKIHD